MSASYGDAMETDRVQVADTDAATEFKVNSPPARWNSIRHEYSR